jgi:phosphoadenosine phosphosulfate reductase
MTGGKVPVRMNIQDKTPCAVGCSFEGTLSRPIDLKRLRPFTHAIAWGMESDEEKDILIADTVTFHGTGRIVSVASVERDARARLDEAFQLVARSEQCTGCGLCVERCTPGALYMKDGKVEIDGDECIFCKDCFGLCPATRLGSDTAE